MKQLTGACLLFAALGWLPADAAASTKCAGLPTQFTGNQFPTGNFFSNFDNDCYLIALNAGHGSGQEQGDLNTVYNKVYFRINPNIPPYEIILLGTFPNARYFSIGLYDSHSAFTQNLKDIDIVPLTSADINPYLPGTSYVSGQRYGVAIHLGGTPGNQQTGCMMTGYNVESNVMDGTQRHPFMNWNLDPAFLLSGKYPLHQVDTAQHTNPNTSSALIVRAYLDLTGLAASAQPAVIVRDVASGCAYPAEYAKNTLQVVTINAKTGNTWQDQSQVQEHNTYANWQATSCWGNIPASSLQWLREDEYVSGANPDAGYLLAYVPSGLPQALLNAGEVMRFRFQVPTTPPTPCTNGCSRSGNEQMRYMSISFQIPGGGTLASLPDRCPANPAFPCTPLIQDPNGFVTLIVGTGVPQPAWVTPANGYTWLDLSQTGSPNYLQLNEIGIRNILPASSFQCTTQSLPYKVADGTTKGAGILGLYAPRVDYPVATSLPATASPLTGSSSCAVYPGGPPEVTSHARPQCGVLTPPPITISTLTTQCVQPGCDQVVAQANAPIAILGNGFGSFPQGIPYSGNSNFLEISDTTQNWTAGYTGSPCTVTIGEWSGSLISLVAQTNQSGPCPLLTGDQLTVTVWNPQTLSSTSATVTVVAHTSPGG